MFLLFVYMPLQTSGLFTYKNKLYSKCKQILLGQLRP